MINIPVLIINLPQSTKRRKHMESLCSEYELTPTFIEAVYGKDLSESELLTCYDKDKAITSFGRELISGEIGCALSHKNAYQKIVDDNIEVALVLEDDVDFSPDLKDILSKINKFPKTWDLVLLGHNAGFINGVETKSPLSFWGRKEIDGYIVGRLAGFGFGTYGYLLNKKGASKLLSNLDVISCPIDLMTSNDKTINVFAIQNTIIKTEINFDSLISNDSSRERKSLKSIKLLLSKIGILKLLQIINKIRKKIQPISRYKR